MKKMNTIIYLFIFSAVCSAVDTIVYTLYIFDKGYGLMDVVMLHDILAYMKSTTGSILTVLSVLPIIIIMLMTRKIKEAE